MPSPSLSARSSGMQARHAFGLPDHQVAGVSMQSCRVVLHLFAGCKSLPSGSLTARVIRSLPSFLLSIAALSDAAKASLIFDGSWHSAIPTLSVIRASARTTDGPDHRAAAQQRCITFPRAIALPVNEIARNEFYGGA